ncbi:MAG TPA: hypothetical protein VNT53_10900 [Pseudolysinimonas sp.]|nr:hypothetical protein [Pseudolysinimonas sp.]
MSELRQEIYPRTWLSGGDVPAPIVVTARGRTGLLSQRDSKQPTAIDMVLTALVGPAVMVGAAWYVFSQAFGS